MPRGGLRAPEETMITGNIVDFGGVFNKLLYSEPEWNAAQLERDLQARELLS